MSTVPEYSASLALSRSAAWVRWLDVEARFRVVPYQEAPSPPMTPALRAACPRALHVVTREGQVLRAGRASVFLIGELGLRRTSKLLGLPPFLMWVEVGYWFVARNRRLAGRLLRRGPPGYQAPRE